MTPPPADAPVFFALEAPPPPWLAWSRRRAPGPDATVKIGHRNCELAAQLAASAFAVPYAEVTAASRGARPAAFARQSAMYLAHVVLGLSYSEIGRAFGRDRTTAAHACRLIEDWRDDPHVDAVLCALEHACRIVCGRLAVRVQP
jgi:hypothetical protein